jgi:hypothetical protein
MKNCHFNILFSSTSDSVMNDVTRRTAKELEKFIFPVGERRRGVGERRRLPSVQGFQSFFIIGDTQAKVL